MKIIVCTTPLRPTPARYPPIGGLAVLEAIRRAGWAPTFYDIDGFRPSFDEVEEYFRAQQPDVVGISAVVSTAYAYTKMLTLMLKRVCPGVRIVVGGNLAASAEILHRLAGVDFCVIGEGETVAVNLVRHLELHPGRGDDAGLRRIKGITFLAADGGMVFTGYETALAPADVYDVDFSVLERECRIENFIQDPALRNDFPQDERTYQPHRKGKKSVVLITAKGCVARCTFCHRWDKGYRSIPVQRIIERIRFFKEKYNVGFIEFADENFGSDRRQVDEFIDAIKKEDILYNIGGVRARTVTPELLRRLKDSGCVAIYYGIETGSQAILDVMEKKSTVENNVNAARWTLDAGLYTIYQFVLGMPGETRATIRETTEFMKAATAPLSEHPVHRMSINYIQALPGTAVYEYARFKGLIGASLLDEERYLLTISDINAQDETKFLNFTQYDYMTVQNWRRVMTLEVLHHYRKENGAPRIPLRAILRETLIKRFWPGRYARVRDDYSDGRTEYTKGGYFNLQLGFFYHVISSYLYPVRTPILWAWLMWKEYLRLPLPVFLAHVADWLRAFAAPPPPPFDYQSLRAMMQACAPKPMTPTELAMAPLRDGR